MLLSNLIKKYSDDLKISNFMDMDITDIQSNSKLIKKNNIFFALDGITFRGINFVDKAIKNGASVIVCSDKISYTNDSIVIMKCKDPLKMLGNFLKIFYLEKPKHIIGITGTSGKTSVMEFARQIIQNLSKDVASIGTLGINYKDYHLKEDTLTMKELVDIHSKLNYLKKEKNIDYVLMEITSQGIHQGRCEGIDVEMGVFNNISPEHLDYHKTMEEYFNQKMRLFTEILKEGSPVVLNADIPEFDKVKKICESRKHKILNYGFNGDIKILNIDTHFQGQNIEFEFDNKKYNLETSFIGKFQVMNLLAALAIVIQLNIEPNIEKIINSMKNIRQAEGRMDLVGIKKNGATVYVDFAHKPDALKQVLETMREHISNNKEARIVVLFGCGGDRDKLKRPLMGKIANDLADVVFVTDDNPRTENPDVIRKEIMIACPKAYNIGNRKKAIEKAIEILEPKDILILAGKGQEKYTIIGKEELPFDEYKIVQQCLVKE